MTEAAVPQAIHRDDTGLTITWTGGRCLLPARDLRLACQCAACHEEMTGRPLLDPASVPDDIMPLKVSLVGAYAIRIDWSDGHSTGLYTYEHLKKLCERRKP